VKIYASNCSYPDPVLTTDERIAVIFVILGGGSHVDLKTWNGGICAALENRIGPADRWSLLHFLVYGEYTTHEWLVARTAYYGALTPSI
jgi:hypothetical protein